MNPDVGHSWRRARTKAEAPITVALILGRNKDDLNKSVVVDMEMMREGERDLGCGERLDAQVGLADCSCLISVC